MKLPGGAEHLRVDASTVAVWQLALGLASEGPQASRPGSSAPCGNTSTFPHTNITRTGGASASVVPVLVGAEVRPRELTSRTLPNPLTSPGTWVAGAASALWSATPKNAALVYEMFRAAALESFSAFRTEDFRRLRPTARDSTARPLQSRSETILPTVMRPGRLGCGHRHVLAPLCLTVEALDRAVAGFASAVHPDRAGTTFRCGSGRACVQRLRQRQQYRVVWDKLSGGMALSFRARWAGFFASADTAVPGRCLTTPAFR